MSQEIIEPGPMFPENEASNVKIMYFIALVVVVASLIPGLVMLSVFAWIGLVIFAYIKRGESDYLATRSHYSNYITVFWVGLIVYIIAIILNAVTLGIALIITVPMLLIAAIWQLYRLIKGLTRVMDNRAYD